MKTSTTINADKADETIVANFYTFRVNVQKSNPAVTSQPEGANGTVYILDSIGAYYYAPVGNWEFSKGKENHPGWAQAATRNGFFLENDLVTHLTRWNT